MSNISRYVDRYYVESCGVTVDTTKNKKEAYDSFDHAGGPDVKLLARDMNGNLHTIQHKTNGFKGHSKVS